MTTEWVLVPREPTANQLIDGGYEIPDPLSHRGEITARRIYSAMLDAAPAAPQMTDAEMIRTEAWQSITDELAHAAYLRGIEEGKRQAAAPQQADAAYTERNHLVALLSKLYPAGKARTAIEGWSPEWHGCVYINFPWGQASWHYHDRDAGLFSHLAPYLDSWDGHTTEAKYELIRQAVAAPQQAEPVAWVRNLTDPQPHCVTGLQYRTAADADAGVQYIPVYLHPPAAEVQRLKQERDGLKNRLEGGE